MITRKLGTNGPDVSAQGLGCMGMPVPRRRSTKPMRRISLSP